MFGPPAAGVFRARILDQVQAEQAAAWSHPGPGCRAQPADNVCLYGLVPFAAAMA